jgi:hypothetical protein
MTDRDPRHEERPPDARPFPRGRDAMRAPVVDRVPSTSAGAFYLMAGVLIAIVLVAGLLFYNPGTLDQLDQARQSIKVQE